MISLSLPHLCRAIIAGGLVLTLAACGSTKPKTADTGGKISAVKYFHLQERTKPIISSDPSISFEKEYHLYGAISNKERAEREGHYYAVLWKATDRSQPVKVRLEYRQQKTGMTVKTKEQDIADLKRNNTTRFEVIGQEYTDGGPVSNWRITLLRGKTVLAEEKSYLWE